MTDDIPPIPTNFGIKYIVVNILWWCWCNAVTVLSSIQGILLAFTLDPTLVDRTVLHWILITLTVLNVILAQINRKRPETPSK